ncbi:Adenosylmethionine-8-amino-7-oxononanoate aminotransferase [Tenacibaculum sp. 190524A02b]|uniref:adenosylmethionine--8-amino-7-oxononanoate transaminase n=1 Tax=Tenacibaculum vairaonense TaxID=3137860 RepID=UPI0032B20FF1
MTLKERDKKHLWHPLTQHKLHPNHIAITKAKDAVLYDDEGNEYIDGIASWYTCMYGHCNEYITSKVYKQMQQLDHVVFAGFTHEPAIKLSEELIKILPNNQEKIFFSDNGSTSVDIAIKMALQYHFNKGEKRGKIIALEDGFHGDTFGAMSVSGLSVYNGPFEDFFIDVERIPVPTEANFEEVKTRFTSLIKENNAAAFIYEPLVQGAAAMKMYETHFLDELISLAQKEGVLVIADEVMTGFGKTGKNFASEYLQNQPDIICLSKSLTAGLVPMAITSCSQKVYDAFLSDELGKGFFHGHTYSANPTACTAALAGVELLQSKEIQKNIALIIASHQAFNEEIKSHPKIKQTRQLGVIYALDLNVEMERYGNLRYQLFDFFMSKGVCLRPLGNTIYILAPFVITKEQLNKVYAAIKEALTLF